MPGIQIGAPEDVVFPHNWSFMQTTEGKILLAARTEMGLMPVFIFHTYEQFDIFRTDVCKSADKFKPDGSGGRMGFATPATIKKDMCEKGLPRIESLPFEATRQHTGLH